MTTRLDGLVGRVSALSVGDCGFIPKAKQILEILREMLDNSSGGNGQIDAIFLDFSPKIDLTLKIISLLKIQ